MGFEIIAFEPNGAEITALRTQINHGPARQLMDALGVPHDDEPCGPGDTMSFTDAELSAAEAALVGIILPDEHASADINEALCFLEEVRVWMLQNRDLSDIEIGFF